MPCRPAVPREPCAEWTMYQVDSHPLLPGWPDSLQQPQAFHQPGLRFSPAQPELLAPTPQPGSSVAWAPESLRLSSSAVGLGLSTHEGTVLEWDGEDSVTEEPKEVVLFWTAFPRPHLPTNGGARLGTQVRRGSASEGPAEEGDAGEEKFLEPVVTWPAPGFTVWGFATLRLRPHNCHSIPSRVETVRGWTVAPRFWQKTLGPKRGGGWQRVSSICLAQSQQSTQGTPLPPPPNPIPRP